MSDSVIHSELLVWAEGLDSESWQFFQCLSDGQLVAIDRASLASQESKLPSTPCKVIFSGQEVLMSSVDMPTRNAKKLRQAIPYALEEYLIAPPESLHFVLGPWASGNQATVAVIAHEDMQSLISLLKRLSLQPRAVIPVISLANDDPDVWSIYVDGDQGWLSLGNSSPNCSMMRTDRENIPVILRQVWAQTSSEARPIALRLSQAKQQDYQDIQMLCVELGLEFEIAEIPSDMPAFWIKQSQQKSGINLLQGPYLSANPLRLNWRKWGLAAGLMMAVLFTQMASTWLELRDLKTQQTMVVAELDDIFAQTFPNARRVDVRRQMESALRVSASGPLANDSMDLSSMINAVADVLQDESGVILEALRFQPGRLDLDLDLASLQVLERTRQRLEQGRYWQVEIQSANAREGRVSSRLQIKESGS